MKYNFKEAMKNNMLHHAFIVEAPLSVDKVQFAMDVAKELCCEESSDGFCNTCSNCTKINSGDYLDLFFIEPDSKTSKTGSIRIEQLLSLQKDLNKKPYGKYNIGIINHGDTISEAGFNKMLKTLEEPSPNSIIIILSENMYKMPNTVLSRCIKVSVQDEKYDLPEDTQGRKEAIELIMLIVDKEYFYRQKNLIEDFVKDRQRGYVLLDNMEKVYRELLFKNFPQHEKFTDEHIMKAIEFIESARRDLYGNGNPAYTIKKMVLAIGG